MVRPVFNWSYRSRDRVVDVASCAIIAQPRGIHAKKEDNRRHFNGRHGETREIAHITISNGNISENKQGACSRGSRDIRGKRLRNHLVMICVLSRLIIYNSNFTNYLIQTCTVCTRFTVLINNLRQETTRRNLGNEARLCEAPRNANHLASFSRDRRRTRFVCASLFLSATPYELPHRYSRYPILLSVNAPDSTAVRSAW